MLHRCTRVPATSTCTSLTCSESRLRITFFFFKKKKNTDVTAVEQLPCASHLSFTFSAHQHFLHVVSPCALHQQHPDSAKLISLDPEASLAKEWCSNHVLPVGVFGISTIDFTSLLSSSTTHVAVTRIALPA